MSSPLPLYERFFVDKGHERIGLFAVLSSRFNVERALYPGSFVHIAPSFSFPHVTYVDNDRRCPRFFADPNVRAYVDENKTYLVESEIEFIGQDFTVPLDLDEASFDLLLSQWTIPTAQICKRYLKVGGRLVANDSHGDATVAFLDDGYGLEAVVHQDSQGFGIEEDDLESYFVVRSGSSPRIEDVMKNGRGPAYRREASMYVFRRL